MKKSKTNRRVNKSVDHGICHCLSCDIEKGEQYIKLKYPKEDFKYEELDFQVRIKPEESFKIRVKIKTIHDYTN